MAHSLGDALAAARTAAEPSAAPRIFIIGGAQLYAEALPLADELVLTEIDADLVGDTRFPAWDRTAFTETGREPHTSVGPPPCGFAFVTYQRQR